jgi:hypothetical protein
MPGFAYHNQVVVNLQMSEEGFWEGLQPSLSPIKQNYAALKSSFVAVCSDRAAILDGLNPFTTNHSAITISCGANTISK